VNFKKLERKAEFDKYWFQMGYGAIQRHSATSSFGGQVGGSKKTCGKSKVSTFIEDNCCGNRYCRSGVGYYYARSILDTKKVSWLKLGWVHPFPSEMVKHFAFKS